MNQKMKIARSEVAAARAAGAEKEWHTALKHWENAIEHWSDNLPPFLIHGKARALLEMNMPDAAEEWLDVHIQRGFDAPSVVRMWARIAIRSGKFALVASRVEACLAEHLEDEPEIAALLAIAHFRNKDQNAARAVLVTLASAKNSELADDATLAFKTLQRFGGARLESKFRSRYEDACTSFGELIGLQHLRNLIHSIPFDSLATQLIEHDAKSGVLNGISTVLSGLLEENLIHRIEAPSLDPFNNEAPRRILFVASHIADQQHTQVLTRFFNSVASQVALLEKIETVDLLISQELAPEGPRMRENEVDDVCIANCRRDLKGLIGQHADKIRILTPQRVGPVFPLASSLDLAVKSKPDIVVSIIGLFGSPLLPRVLAKARPSVAIQVNSDNPEPDYADIVLAHGRPSGFSDKPTPEKWRRHSIPVIAFPKEARMEQAELGPSVNVRVTTALTGTRLNKLLFDNHAANLEVMFNFLNEFPDVGWAIVGADEPAAMEADAKAVHNFDHRLSFCGFLPDLRAAYEHCDIYMLPLGQTGGGMAVAMAIAEGVPAIVPTICDAANFLPTESTYETMDEGLALLRKLALDPSERIRQAQAQQLYIQNNHSVAAVAEEFYDILKAAQIRFYSSSLQPIPSG